MLLPKRKANRLPSYDYSQNGAYFITICTKDMRCILWDKNSSPPACPTGTVHLSATGHAAESCILEISVHYPGVTVEKYVIMPNHLHMILLLAGNYDASLPAVSRIVHQMKSAMTKRIGSPVWQKSFHDHVIRDEKEYLAVWEYIERNPLRWREDCYYQDMIF